MKRYSLTFLSVVLLAGLNSAAFAAASQKISVVDFDKVWRQAKAAQQVRGHIEDMRLGFQKEVIKLEGTLRAKEEDLQAQQSSLSPTEYQDLRGQFEDEVKDVQKQVQLKKQKLEKAFQSSMTLIRNKLNEAVAFIAKAEAADIVLSETQVAFHGTESDLTEKVLAHLDETLPQIDMPALTPSA